MDRLLLEKDRQLDARLNAVDIKIGAIQEAVRVANGEMNRRLEGMNEMRAQLDRQSGLFLTREMFDREHRALGDRLDANVLVVSKDVTAISKIIDNWQGRIVILGIAWSAIVVVAGWVLHSLTK